MKIPQLIRKVPTCLLAGALMLLSLTTGHAAAPALQGSITLRPLTPQELITYSLPGVQTASGLSAVALGQPAYFEVIVNAAIAPSNIVSVTWTLTNKPINSFAALTNSPLGTNVPTYKIADRFNNTGGAVYQVAGRTLLRPDVTGQYTVTATVTTIGSGSTNLSLTISGSTYLGANTCALCHSGGVLAEDKYHPWTQTPHATAFTLAIDGKSTDHFSKNCISCHTVGFDSNTNSANGGFDDVAAQVHWTFPAVLTNGNWAAMPAALQNVANVQCENCHGPGSEHAFALGNTNASNWPRLAVTYSSGNCAQCHDSLSHHSKTAEWNNSVHARVTRTPSGTASRAQCVRCHTAAGFAGYAKTLGTTNVYTTNNLDVAYEAITCAACHEPHDDGNPSQLRAGRSVVLADGTTVTNAGSGAFCMNCHTSRNGNVTNSIVKYPLGQQTWAGGSAFGPHDNPASDMLEGVNGWTYGQNIPSSAHRFAVSNSCVGCHMQSVASTDPAFTLAGGHTWNMTYPVVTSGVTNTVDLVNVCIQCHGQMSSFDMVKVDYNGDGIIEGVQTEVQHLLDKLSTLLPNSTYRADGNYIGDGLIKSPSTKTNWQVKFLEAAYNFQFVNNDLSKGVHNAAYAVGLLKASIGDLTGDANNDGIPDAWQIQFFGSTGAANAAPNANPSGDGVPNWLKWSLGLDPTVAGQSIPGGVVWANGKSLNPVIDPTQTNTIAIYTAAEVVFNTEVGKSYQIQAVTALSDGWQNVGTPIAGTGNPISYVTPTRSNVQQFYRVNKTP